MIFRTDQHGDRLVAIPLRGQGERLLSICEFLVGGQQLSWTFQENRRDPAPVAWNRSQESPWRRTRMFS